MTTQRPLFPSLAPTVNPAAHLPRVPCGGGNPDRGCGALMVWVHTESGARMPIDRDPVPDGNVVFTSLTSGVVRYLRKGETVPEGVARFVSHFSTCPRAADFRRR